MDVIKHIIFSGGGPVGLVQYGALKQLALNNIIKYENIESIYATSIGSFIGFIYLLNFEWSWIDDFFIKRPWEKLINFTYNDYINIFYNKGLANKDVIINALKSLFYAKDIPINITLLEFYKITNIEFNIFASNLNSFKKEKFNHINSPNMELLDALYISCSIPILFVPLYINECFYLDGGIFVNCPLNECFIDKKCKHNEILCFNNDKRDPIDLSNNFYKKFNYNFNNINELNYDSNFIDYIIYIIKTLFNKISIIENENSIIIKNIINTSLTEQMVDIKYWLHVLNSCDERHYLINLGKLQANKFIENNSNNIMDICNNFLNNVIISDICDNVIISDICDNIIISDICDNIIISDICDNNYSINY